MIPGVLVTAALDRRLTGHDLSIYLFLWAQLDVLTYRPLKHAWLARRVQLQRQNVQRSLGHLIACGYLERGATVGRLATYRLIPNLLAPDAATLTRRAER